MAITLNHSLFLENASDAFKLKEYNNQYENNILEQSTIVSIISECNEEIRNSRLYLVELYNLINLESVNDVESLAKIDSGMKKIFSSILNTIKRIGSVICDAIKRAIGHIPNSESYYFLEDRIGKGQYYDALSAAINENSDCAVQIKDIYPGDLLFDPNVPQMKLSVADKFVEICDLVKPIAHKAANYIGTEKRYIENFAENITIDEIITDIKVQTAKELSLDGFDIRLNSLENLAINSKDKMFGYDKVASDRSITFGLYQQAKDNICNKYMINNLESMIIDTKIFYGKMYDKLSMIFRQIEDMLSASKGSVISASVATNSSINKINDAISDIINAHLILVSYKMKRISSIYDDSHKVIRACDGVVMNWCKENGYAEIENKLSSFNPSDDHDIHECEEQLESLIYTVSLLSEMYKEESTRDFILSAIYEADGDNNNAADTAKNIAKSATNVVAGMIKKLAENVVMFAEKMNRSIKSGWWEKNKERVEKLDESKLQVSDICTYHFDRFDVDTYVPFNDQDKNLDSDEEFQNSILDKIGGNGSGTNTEGKSFGEKVRAMYIIHDEPKSDPGVQISQLNGYNKANVIKFLDECGNGFGTGLLNNIEVSLKKIQSDYAVASKKAKDATDAESKNNQTNDNNQNQQNQNTNQAANKVNDGTPKNAASATATTATVKPAAQNASAIDDFKFNLAETLGLVNPQPLSELTVNNDSVEKVNASDAKTMSDKVDRCFKNNITAASIRMNEIFKAYKTYINVYSLALGEGSRNGDFGEDDKNNNNQQQQQQKANQKQ